MAARVLPFSTDTSSALESEPRIPIAVLPGDEDERLTIHRIGDRQVRFELVWQRYAEGVGWYRLRSVTLTAAQARGLGEVLGNLDGE